MPIYYFSVRENLSLGIYSARTYAVPRGEGGKGEMRRLSFRLEGPLREEMVSR